MRKYLFVLAALFLCGNLLFAQTSQKIGYVDSQLILNQLPEAIKAQGDLDALTNKWSSHLDSLKADYQQALEDYQKQANTMPDNKKQLEQQKLIAQQNSILDFQKEKFAQGTGEIYKMQDKIFTPVKNKIYKAIQDVAKQEAMKFVFDKAGDVVLLYADPAFDITYKVLDKLKTDVK